MMLSPTVFRLISRPKARAQYLMVYGTQSLFVPSPTSYMQNSAQSNNLYYCLLFCSVILIVNLPR